MQEKVEYLSQKLTQLITQNRSLKDRLDAVEDELTNVREAAVLAERENESLKLAQNLQTEDTNTEEINKIKQKINEYIREIDQCLLWIGA